MTNLYRVPHFIHGGHCLETDSPQHDIYNPAYGKIIGKVNFASAATCEQAIRSSLSSWEGWSNTTPAKRVQILFRFRHLLEKHQEKLARIVTREHGKTLADARGSIARSIEIIEWHCGLTMQLQGTFSPNVSSHIDCYTFRQPLGVCAGISPFNFPVMVPVWMMIPAIACGNTFILKPSEQDPSAAVFLLELLKEAGLPDGVINCVHGNQTTVEYLLQHPDIAAFTAVASTPVARSIYTQATSYGKRSHTFGSAKNHCLVMPDADFEQTARAIVGAAYGAAGERCMAISAIVTVGESSAQQLITKMLPLIQKIRIDSGEVPHCDMGPLISQAHRQRVLHAIEQGLNEGAKLLVDGRDFIHSTFSEGFFVGPTLFDEVLPSMFIYQQEIFGPVLIILRVNDFEEALTLVNQNQYGNGTAIFTRDGYVAREYCQRVNVGMVGVNVPIPVPVASHPFGGWKNSIFGDSNMHGVESIHFYTKLKTVTSQWVTTSEANSFVMPING